jgi:hypothetical protein
VVTSEYTFGDYGCASLLCLGMYRSYLNGKVAAPGLENRDYGCTSLLCLGIYRHIQKITSFYSVFI